MDSRVAVIAIIVQKEDAVEKLNGILHAYGKYVISRMGVPYRERGIHVISLALDAPQDVTSALAGKLGRLEGVSAKALYAPADLPSKEGAHAGTN